MPTLLRSFSDRTVTYAVDKANARCSCPGYSPDGGCKHLEAVGVYKRRHATLSSHPSFAQALSGLVKGIRVRDQFEAAYWLHYCWQFRFRLPGSQFRTVRRLLIGSAEDGHSIAVMERMAGAFGPLLAKDAAFEDVLIELLHICKVPNWWHPESGGPDYIYSGMLGDRLRLYSGATPSPAECLDKLDQAIAQSDRVMAISWILRAEQLGGKIGGMVADRLLQIAVRQGHGPALRILGNVYGRHANALTNDSNFTGQAAWLLAGGHFTRDRPH